LSKKEKLKRFFQKTKDPDEWQKEYAKMVAFVEREGGVTVTEDYPHLKLLNQFKYFAEFKHEDWTLLGKMIGAIK